jgi:hypothetical protein
VLGKKFQQEGSAVPESSRTTAPRIHGGPHFIIFGQKTLSLSLFLFFFLSFSLSLSLSLSLWFLIAEELEELLALAPLTPAFVHASESIVLKNVMEQVAASKLSWGEIPSG